MIPAAREIRTGHATQCEQARMIRRYMVWRNNHAYNEKASPHHRPGKHSFMRH
jgi:hypothetical protein